MQTSFHGITKALSLTVNVAEIDTRTKFEIFYALGTALGVWDVIGQEKCEAIGRYREIVQRLAPDASTPAVKAARSAATK